MLIQEATNPTYLLAWIPETLLNEKGTGEWDKFVKIEERAPLEDEDDGLSLLAFVLTSLTYLQTLCSSICPPNDLNHMHSRFP